MFRRPRGSSFSTESICTMSVSDATERTQNDPEPSHRARRAELIRYAPAYSLDLGPETSVIEYPDTLPVDQDVHIGDRPVTTSPNHNSADEPAPTATATSRTLINSVPSMTEFIGTPALEEWRCLPLEYWAQNDEDCWPRFIGLDRQRSDVRGLLANRHEGSRGDWHSGLRVILPGLLVIDCFSSQVVAAETNCEFVALSYVWGSRRGGGEERFQSDLRDRRLPQTVQDAMNVVRVLGMRFLWVDRYCINNSELSTKHHMISNMDAIYGAAFLTIIAAAGSDDGSGLPSVSRLVRGLGVLEGTVPPWNGFVHAEFSDPAREQWENSTWSTRGWTYQEGLLSQRHLTFTETRVTLRCDMDRVSESGGIFAHINEYSRRSLTYPSDSLKAFLGVFRAYERLPSPVLHIWGVPFLLDPSGNIQNPGQGLLWKGFPFPRLHRIQGLPSWSWAGWSGWCAQDVADWYLMSRRFQLGPYHWLIKHLRRETAAWEPSDITLEILTGSQLTDISDYFRAGHRPPSGEIGGPPPVLYLIAWSTTVNIHTSKKAYIRLSDEDLNASAATIDPAPESLYKVEPQMNGQWACKWTAAIICWGARNATAASVRDSRTQSLLLERVGDDTFRRVGILETNWHKSDLDEQGRIAASGRTFTRTRLRIV